MRPVVVAAAIAFGPHLKVLRRPARTIGRVAMKYMDRRRKLIDGKR